MSEYAEQVCCELHADLRPLWPKGSSAPAQAPAKDPAQDPAQDAPPTSERIAVAPVSAYP